MTSTASNTIIHDASAPSPSRAQPPIENEGSNQAAEVRNVRKSSAYEKHCWVCFGTDENGDSDEVWLHPCKCHGSAKWVHEYCLQRWVDEKQKGQLNLEVRCAQCNTPYKMIFPTVGPLTRLLASIDIATAKISPLLGTAMIASALHWQATCLGAITVLNIYGVRRGVALLRERPPIVLFLVLPTIPITLILCQMSRWRARTAHWLYRKMHPSESNNLRIIVPANAVGGRSMFRDLFSALLYPAISVRVAKAIFHDKYYSDPPKYAFIGGLVYSGVHAVFSIYYRYMQVYRGENRQIANRTECDDSRSSEEHVLQSDEEDEQDMVVTDEETDEEVVMEP